jgi:hypothetical protein
MTRISIQNDDLVVEIEGLDKLWSLKSRLVIPLANVRGATADPGITGEPKGVRAPGTSLPGVITAGTFHQDGEQVFWNVRDGARAVVIQLADERYTRLIVEVTDPGATVALIERALRR